MKRIESRSPQPAGFLPRACAILFASSVAGCHLGVAASTSVQPLAPAHLELLEPITIPAGSAHTVFQEGRQTRGADHYRLACEIEVEDVRDVPQTVQPDRFRVVRAGFRRLRDELAGIPEVVPGFRWDCTEDVFLESRWWLRSERQPQVRVLICREAFPACRAPMGYPDRASILRALGPGFAIR